MTDVLETQAEKLAARPYKIVITRDESPEEEPAFVAYCPELPGCMTHGATVEAALDNLKDAKRQYILSLLEDGLPVPMPAISATETTVYTSTTTSAFIIATASHTGKVERPDAQSVMDDFVAQGQAQPGP